MSISFRKINGMISQEVDACSDLTERQKRALREACEKIYMLETSIESVSSHQTISDIRAEILLKADEYSGEER